MLKNIIARTALLAIGLSVCAAAPLPGNTQGNTSPAGNDWKVFCNATLPGSTRHASFPFQGSYGDALKSSVCDASGGVLLPWDSGLASFSRNSDVHFAPGNGDIGSSAEWARSHCAAITCVDGARNRYAVTFLDKREGDRGYLSCERVGLRNPARDGSNPRASRKGGKPGQCAVGVVVVSGGN